MATNQDYAQLLSSLKSSKFRQLWPAQAYILDAYSSTFREKPDVAVELPTGAGKTLIALLVAETWRREGNPVAILSANKTLARQMLGESKALGVPAVLMEGAGANIPARDKRAYQRATHVAIMNYWVYFNQNPVIDPAGLVVMDDAHLAEHCLHSLYSVEIRRSSHESLFKGLVEELLDKFPDYSILVDALADDAPIAGATELLSFIDQTIVADRLRQVIDVSPYLDTDTDLGFRWRRLRNHLLDANIYLGLHSIWIRPYVYPLMANLHYEQSQQRIYMSATMGDTGDLCRRLGVKPIEKIPVPAEHSEKTMGRRLVVMNTNSNEGMPAELWMTIVAALAVHPKSLWLCSSQVEAVSLQLKVTQALNASGLVGHPTWVLTPLGDEIDQFKRAPKGHLFVGGRFDGMDFNADECRLVILASLPRATNSQEEFISAYLRDSGFMLSRLNHRIVQALGRCNRSDRDFAVYVLADPRFSVHFGRESHRAGIPRNLVAEIDLAQDSAEGGMGDVAGHVVDFLNKDFSWYDSEITAYLDAVPTRAPSPAAVDTSADEVLGWTALFDSQNYEVAANRFERCWESAKKAGLLEIAALHGWNWSKALYLQFTMGDQGARERSLRNLEEAITRGGRSSWFNRMRASVNRAKKLGIQAGRMAQDEYADVVLRAFDDLLGRLGASGTKFEKWCNDLEGKLSSDRHDEYASGLELLGQALGYQPARPRHGAATDCMWRGVFGNMREVVTFEAKIEHRPTQEVTASDVGQAHNQHTRAQTEYGLKGFTVRSVIVTHLTSIASDADAAAGPIRVVPKAAVLELWSRVHAVLSAYRDKWSVDDFAARSLAAEGVRSRIPNTGWLTQMLSIDERFIPADRVVAEWK